MSTAPLLSRHLGDYLLVASLSEDALGSVFRALHAADERRFVRLRILRSAELDPEAIEASIRENAARSVMLAHPAIVDRTLFDRVEGLSFMTWEETSGWTLDTMLARVRAFGIRIPAEYALLIAERIAAALEHAHRTVFEGRPVHHGLLWPGFVSISHDATVRVGGFGLAEGVVPSLDKPRVRAEVAPYLAPETRRDGTVDACTDVYALGMILAELLTGRRPTVDAPPPELRAGDPRSDELETFLHRCVAPRGKRFPSAVDAHREIQRMVTGNPFSLYTANLALFLYKLLNPESQLAAPSSDWENTNPVVVDGSSTQATRRARQESEAASEEASPPVSPVPVAVEPALSATPAVEPSAPVLAASAQSVDDAEDAEITAALETIAPVESSDEVEAAIHARAAASALGIETDGPATAPQTSSLEQDSVEDAVGDSVDDSVEEESVEFEVEVAVAIAEPVVAIAEPVVAVAPPPRVALDAEASGVIFRFPRQVSAEAPAAPPSLPEDRAPAPPAIPPEVTAGPVAVWATAWTRPASALAAAAGLTVGAFLLISQFHASAPPDVASARPSSSASRLPGSAAGAEGAAASSSIPSVAVQPLEASQPAEISVAAAAPVAVVLSGGTGRVETAKLRQGQGQVAAPRTGKPAAPTSRLPAEDLRLRAALARIEADRVNAQQTAGDLFGEGRHSEQEGERLLRERDYQAAELAFSRAARLFQQAQELSWQQRLRDANLSSEQ